MPSRHRRIAVLGATLGLATALAAPVGATTPGKNGNVVWLNDQAIVVTDLAGALPSDGTVLVPNSVSPRYPHFSPDGTRIAYIALDDTSRLNVFVMDADGSDIHQVTDVCETGEVEWTPDGAWLVFSQYRCDNTSERIARIRPDGTGLAPITTFKDDRYDFEPVVSPDGHRVAFSTGVDGSTLVFANPFKPASDAANRTRWSDNAYYQSFSPDGKRLLFGFTESATIHFGFRKLSGGPITEVDAGNFLDYTPDGRSFVYSLDTGPGYQLWMRRVDGSGSPVLIGPATGTSSGPTIADVQALCTISGNGRANTLNGTSAPELICGKGGNDTIDGKGGLDLILGGPGNDKVKGGPGDDTLVGETGDDRLDGGTGKDRCVQGPGTGLLISC